MKSQFNMESGVNMLLDMIYAPMYTKTLFAAIELDIFSELKTAKLHHDVAKKLELHSDNTKFLLNALVAMELLEKEEGLYKNTALANKYLLRDSEWFIGDHLKVYHNGAGFEETDLVKLVKDGPNGQAEGKEGLEAYAIFGDWAELMKTQQRGGRAKELSNLVSALPEFSSFKKMLDLGGGPGLICLAIVNKHPELKAAIFDTAEVGKVAMESVKEYGLENRVEVLTGDYMKDSIGSDYDFILAIGTLNFVKHDLDGVVRKIYDALRPNGVFMCISDGLTCEDTSPKNMVISWLPSVLKGFDFQLRQGEVSDAALRNGFRSVYKQTISMLTGDMDVDIARK
ncbi:MAG: class I SAM-dependent methyltransferase [Anaerotignum sp.]|nr:class I SAM-dependent methyltransferase [Anaerotignum sp.]